nr:immunoglobulin light chain junction region [Macaca mulatta]
EYYCLIWHDNSGLF